MKIVEYFKKRKSIVIIRLMVAAILILLSLYAVFFGTERVTPPDEAFHSATIKIVGAGGEVVLERTEMGIKSGATVFDMIDHITEKKDIPFEFSGIGDSLEILRIGNSQKSGAEGFWVMRVNGEFMSVFESAGITNIYDGDIVELLYTENMGEDIGMPPELAQ
ncbi:MAG TPA: hypothetical protein DEQ02_00205 [Ruminococcaceae bacterium]|nr:hypothetical protein [Oscillospiraceae bacterium]